MSEALAAIIAALITAIGTLIATNFERITQTLKKSSRNVTGDWLVVSDRVADGSWVGEFNLKLKQSGVSVMGEMTAIKVEEGKKLYNYKWSGKVIGEYLVYECIGTDPSTFMISSGLLYIYPTGEEMTGYFVANRGAKRPEPTWVGSTKLKKKG